MSEVILQPPISAATTFVCEIASIGPTTFTIIGERTLTLCPGHADRDRRYLGGECANDDY